MTGRDEPDRLKLRLSGTSIGGIPLEQACFSPRLGLMAALWLLGKVGRPQWGGITRQTLVPPFRTAHVIFELQF